MAKKWIPIDGSGRALMAELELTDIGDKTVPRFRIWAAGSPEPPGNPFRIAPDVLRSIGYKPEDEGKDVR